MKLNHRLLLLIIFFLIIVWFIYTVFMRIQEAFSDNTVSIPYYFNTNTLTKNKGGSYTVSSFPENATKLNNIEFYTCTRSNGPDAPSSYTRNIKGPTIDSGGTSVQFKSPSYNKKGQSIGNLSIHNNRQQIMAMNPKNSVTMPCNINENGKIVGTTNMPGSILKIIGIANDNFNNPTKKTKAGNNVMMLITYGVSS